MQLTITLPEAVHSLLAAHPKGPEAAVLIAIKRYLKATASEGRDRAIADEAVRGATHAELANKYALSIPRIQQLVAIGRDAALLRNPPPAAQLTHTTTNPTPKPKRVLTPQDIHNIHRMRSEGALASEMMQVFSISMSELQDALWSAPPTHTTTTTRTPTPAHTTTTRTPTPTHDFDMREITG